MIIPDLFLWIVGIIAFCLVIFVYLKYKGLSWNSFKVAVGVGFLAAIGAVLLITVPAKRIVIVEDFAEDSPGYYRHTEISCYGHPDVKLHSGDSFPTKGLQLAVSKKYLFNYSNSGMLLYPIVYGNSSGLPSSFKKAENYKSPDPIYIEPGCYDEIPSCPGNHSVFVCLDP